MMLSSGGCKMVRNTTFQVPAVHQCWGHIDLLFIHFIKKFRNILSKNVSRQCAYKFALPEMQNRSSDGKNETAKNTQPMRKSKSFFGSHYFAFLYGNKWPRFFATRKF